MSYARRSRYSSRSPSPYHGSRYCRSVSLSPSRSRSWSRSRDFADTANPGNNLYVTGLSSRITKGEIEEHFASEGKVVDIHLVVDPYTRESRGFGFVTMANIEEANRCIKYLDGSVLEDRVITVEKAKRRRGRTPTPGRYLGLQTSSGRCHSTTYSPDCRGRCSSSDRERSFSPYYYRRRRSASRSRSPYYRRHSPSPIRRRRYHYRDSISRSPLSPYYSRRHYYRSVSRNPSPRMRRSRRSYSISISPTFRKGSRRSYSRSISPTFRKGSRRSYLRSISPRGKRARSYSRSISPRGRRPRRSYSMSPSSSASPKKKRDYRESYSHSRSSGSHSRSVSRSSVRSG